MIVAADNFGLAHYLLVRKILSEGNSIPTDYDKGDEKPSLDISVAIEVRKPWSPPIFSKCVYDSADGMIEYVGEIVDGAHDDDVDKMGYTYHDRFKEQLPGVIDELRRNPHTRRAQYITWRPDKDLGDPYPPCHQRGWFRVIDGKLDFHTTWRSRDVFKAWGSNVFGFAHLHKKVASELNYPIGKYVEWIDSAHIYGRDIDLARNLAQRQISDWLWTLEEIQNEKVES